MQHLLTKKNTMIPPGYEEVYNAMPFPMKLHAMLRDAEREGMQDIVAWQPECKSFKVHDPDRFATEVMPEYFNQTKYKSFQRQLNIYSFKKVHHGPNKGGYIHPLFTRDSPELCERILRRPSKQFNSFGSSSSLFPKGDELEVEPINPFKQQSDFSAAATFTSDMQPNAHIDLKESEVKAFYDFFYPEDPNEKEMVSSIFNGNTAEDRQQASAISSSLSPKEKQGVDEFDEVDFDCFRNLLGDDAVEPVAKEDEGLESESVFPAKLHLMLESAESEGYAHIVSWVKGGSAFKVHDIPEFVNKVMPNYFDQTKYESFRRQLNLYAFKRVSRGVNRGVISHPCFIKGHRWLCGNILRK